MMNKRDIIPVVFTANFHTENVFGLEMWDKGQRLEIKGIEFNPDRELEVHFSLDERKGDANKVIPEIVDDTIYVDIPQYILTCPYAIPNSYNAYAWIYYKSGESGKTEYKIRMHINVRPKPEDYIYTEEELKTWEQIRKNLETKLTQPEEAEVGQIFRVKAKNEDGTITLESVDMPKCDVTDVQINGESIVGDNGVANVPFATRVKPGILKPYESQFEINSNNNGVFYCVPIPNEAFMGNARRNTFGGISGRIITTETMDSAVKTAMCDGKGATWTAEEQDAARKRMGIPALIDAQKPFIAEYGVATYEELLNAFKSNKQLALHVPAGKTSTSQPEMYAPLVRLDNGGVDVHNFVFVCEENSVEHHFIMSHDSKQWTSYDTTLATNDYAKILDKNIQNLSKNLSDNISLNSEKIIKNAEKISANSKLINDVAKSTDSIGQYIAGKDSLLSALGSMNAVGILNSVYSFRGGFHDYAGTLHIKTPGIYLVLQGGTDNKKLVITQNGAEVLNDTYNGIIIMAYESGAITPIGIKTSLTLSGTIKMPGTYQGWTADGSCSTTITYPKECVIAYLGNGNVNYLG